MLMTSKRVSHHGFTIVELLIVIVVIAVVASITVVAYNGITQRAKDASVQTELGVIDQSMKLFFSENDRYPLTFDDMKSSTANMPLNKMVFSSQDDTNSTSTQNYTGAPRTPKGSYRANTTKRTVNWYGGRIDTSYSFSIGYYSYKTNSWMTRGFTYGSTTWVDPTLELTTHDDRVVQDNPGRDGDASHNIPCVQQYYEDCLPTIIVE